MTKKEVEMIFLITFFALVIIFCSISAVRLAEYSMTKDSEIQELKEELALNKVEAKAKCNKRFLGIGK